MSLLRVFSHYSGMSMNGLSGNPAFAQIEQKLKRRLVRWMRETGDPLLAAGGQSSYKAGLEDPLTAG